MIYVNWMALYNLYRIFGIGIFIAGFTIRLVGKNRKAKSVEKAGKIMMILTIPLIVLAFLEAIGLNTRFPVFNFSLYDFF